MICEARPRSSWVLLSCPAHQPLRLREVTHAADSQVVGKRTAGVKGSAPAAPAVPGAAGRTQVPAGSPSAWMSCVREATPSSECGDIPNTGGGGSQWRSG
jgi:hypothetical protein